MLSLQDIYAARRLTAPWVRHTPLERSAALEVECGGPVFLKLENQQVTGSFKARGPICRLQRMAPDERRRGVVAPTAGNHGAGLSRAGRVLGVPVHLHVIRNADPGKMAMLREHGAVIHLHEDYEAAHRSAVAQAESEGLVYVSPYSHPDIIAADGVVALELLQDLPDLEVVAVPVGGGGLAAGIALALKAANPAIEVWGVESAASPTFTTWREAGRPVTVTIEPGMAEGLVGYVEPETLTWPLLRRHLDRMLTVSDAELLDTMRLLLDGHRQVAEPSGAAGAAALRRESASLRGRRAVAVVSGGNISWGRLKRLLA